MGSEMCIRDRFFLISNSLSASVVNPTMHDLIFLLVNFIGMEFSFTKGMFDVLNPLFAKYMDVGVLLVLLTPSKMMSDFSMSSI